jgi:hypothetical protein
LNAPVAVPELTEVHKIEDALDAILGAIVKLDEKPRQLRAGDLKSLDMAAILSEIAIPRTRDESFARKIAREPVREALCYAVRRLGKRLHEIGGLTAMQNACDRVGGRDERRWGQRVSIMDARWDGVGRDAQNAGWCS